MIFNVSLMKVRKRAWPVLPINFCSNAPYPVNYEYNNTPSTVRILYCTYSNPYSTLLECKFYCTGADCHSK